MLLFNLLCVLMLMDVTGRYIFSKRCWESVRNSRKSTLEYKRKNELRSYTFNYSGNISASVSACDLMQFNVERSVMEDGDLAYL